MSAGYWLLLATLVAANAASAGESVRRTVPADADGEVRISNVAGEIRVRGWDRAEVDVRAELGAGVDRLDVLERPNGIDIKVVLSKPGIRSGSADLDIRVPAHGRIEISAVSAQVSLDGHQGEARIKVVSGDVSARTSGQVLEAQSVSGDVALNGGAGSGQARLRSVSGDVRIRDYSGAVEAASVSGDVIVELDEVQRARLATTSGDLWLSGTLLPAARIEAETVSGDVKFELKGEGESNVEIETHSGDIGGCYADRVVRKHAHGPGRMLVLEGKAEGATIRVQTLSGDTSFCDR